MNLDDIQRRHVPPEPWAEGDNIPWNEPGFSERMLREHLSQSHDGASRRFSIIDEHVRVIHQEILSAAPSKVLDLGCGPGLYANRLAELGHDVVGIDYSPASIVFARQEAVAAGHSAHFIEADVREATFGGQFDLVLILFGEFNVFHPEVGSRLLERCAFVLVEGGTLLLELSSYDGVKRKDTQTHWYTTPRGLWSDRPHVCIQESNWDPDSETTTVRYFIVDTSTSEVQAYGTTYQAYGSGFLASTIERAGFDIVDVRESLAPDLEESGMLVVVARKVGDKSG